MVSTIPAAGRAAAAGPGPLPGLARRYTDALLAGERQEAIDLVLAAVDGGADLRDVYLDVLQVSQHEIGRLWEIGRVSVAREHYCTAVTQLVMSRLEPAVFHATRNGRRMIATCVGPELHELGARMVADFFELEGWDTSYLGANLPVAEVVKAVDEMNPELLAISTTMTHHLPAARQLIRAVRERSAYAPLVLVGGHAFNRPSLSYREFGADGHGVDAREAVRRAAELLESRTAT